MIQPPHDRPTLDAASIDEATYAAAARDEVAAWRAELLRPPSAWDRASRGMQDRINNAIPAKVHETVTGAVEAMVRGVMTGSHHTTARPLLDAPLTEREARARERIGLYRTTAAAEGGVAGAGGFLLAAADFPVLLSLKIKLLFEIGALYGHSGRPFEERLLILRVFQLAFCSARHRPDALAALDGWISGADRPISMDDFDWLKFQQEYRDFIDLAKLAQLLPIVGAPVGAVVNYRLVVRLGRTAMNAYRMRTFSEAGGS